jgi:sterol desaturase/sphingolipid hydroxylase (fatty acid hydroxylase superfamily)
VEERSLENLILVASIVVMAALERLPPLRFEPRRLLRAHFLDDAACLLTGGVALALAMRWAVNPAAGLISPAASTLAALPFPIVLVAAIVLYDLGGWLTHWLLHRFEPLWEIHKVHHSSRALDWLAAFRAHVLEHGLRHALSMIPLVLFGFPPLAIGTAAAVYASWAAFNHSNLQPRFRLLEPLFVTPRSHRLHHVPTSSEKNFGTIFSLWDRAAGRLVGVEASRSAPLGVPGELATYPQTWAAFTREPLRRITSGLRRRPSRPYRTPSPGTQSVMFTNASTESSAAPISPSV